MIFAVQFVIPGKPAAWQRARSNGKVRFDSPEQAAAKRTLSQIGFSAMDGHPPLEGPLEVTVAAYWPWPKSMSKKKRKTYGSQYRTSTPDLDNCMKILGDALNGIVWRDDSSIVTLKITKRYGLIPQTVVRVEELVESEIEQI